MNLDKISDRLNRVDGSISDLTNNWKHETEKLVTQMLQDEYTLEQFTKRYYDSAQGAMIGFKDRYDNECRCDLRTFDFDAKDSRQVSVIETLGEGMWMKYGNGCICCSLIEACACENGINFKITQGSTTMYVMDYAPPWRTSIVETYVDLKYGSWKSRCQEVFKLLQMHYLMEPAQNIENDTCSICLERLDGASKDIVTPCDCEHAFHKECLCDWWKTKVESEFYDCPNCKVKCGEYTTFNLPDTL